MMVNQTLEKLKLMKLPGMVIGYEEQMAQPDMTTLSFDERLGLLVDREEALRTDRRFKRRIMDAKLKQSACIEDVEFSDARGFTKAQIMQISGCDWIRNKQDLILTGPTGVGKSYMASAIVHKACQVGYSASFVRFPRLLQDIAIAKADGSYTKAMQKISKVDVLVLDDWGIGKLGEEESKEFLEVIEERHKTRSTIFTSQVPLEKWFEIIGDTTIADAIMDRLVNNSHKIQLVGKSMRRKKSTLTRSDAESN